ncbi:unnamed protein product [Arabis nemorensis]|uniref:Uncharacterized protein n=1 Tax=Arabis nemorensis TaxID=586526 RepID=A0A565CCE5_9BRAS|nr:unnamed protein product [Arabis nemorensis]
MRGLIFGPARGEVAMSESGKRLRVESMLLGEQADFSTRMASWREGVITPLCITPTKRWEESRRGWLWSRRTGSWVR